MEEVARELRKTLEFVLPFLKGLDERETSARPSPGKWTKKEIIGHLIDSACNNQQKFVRTMAQPHFDFVGYKQNFWVEAQKYNDAKWDELIGLWQTYNLHLAHVIERVSPEVLPNTITIEGAGTFSLEFIMKDYVEHLKHHLKQALPTVALESNFENIYNT